MRCTTSYFDKIVPFLESVGIEIAAKHLTASTFLPGLELGANTIYIDYTKLKYPGDILHEAGHIAVTHPQQRRLIGTSQMPPKWPDSGDEIAAILWSFAAAKYLEIPVETVFHPHGYKGSSNWYIENFSNKNYIGLPLLQWMGIAYTNEEVDNGNSPFPVVKNWMRT